MKKFFISVLFVIIIGMSYSCTENEIIYSDVITQDIVQDVMIQDIAEDDTHPDVVEKSCKYIDDCNQRQSCVDFKCVPAEKCRCENISEEFCGCAYKNGEDCRPYHICYKQRWVRICETDMDCSDDAHCNNGLCEPYTFKINAKAPYQDGGSKTTLKVGYGYAYLDVPVGVSMAGYGARKGPKTPYNKELGGSTGFWDRPTVKAVVFDNGVERIVYVRNGLGWSQDYLISGIAKELEKRFSENYIDKILMSSSHSHSYPARFWHLLPEMGLGVLGHDKFNKEIWERCVKSHADAIEMAIKNMVPARLGYILDDNFDPGDYITRNRRQESMPFKDKRSAIIKVEYDGGEHDGKILAVIMRYGSHATHMQDTLMTGDAPIAAEMISEEVLSSKLGYFVPVVYMNGDAGNTAPAGDKNPDGKVVGRKDIHQIQAIGYYVAKYILDRLPLVKTKNDIELEMVTKRIPFSRKYLGYKDNEFFKYEEGKPIPYYLGAFQCCVEYKAGGYKDGELGCLLETSFLNYNRPVYQFTKSRLAAANLGGLYLVSVNGEPSAQYGDYVVKELKNKGMKDVITVGFSMDHHLYILLRDEWLLGGYESSMSIWGFKNGEYIAKESIELASQLLTPEKENNHNNLKPEWWEDNEQPVVPLAAKEKPAFFVNPPASVVRTDIVLAKWHGGHPGVDNPVIYLQKKNGGNFEDVKFAGGISYTDTHFHMIVEFLGNYKDNADWQLKWEEKVSFDTGIYRFKVKGNYIDTNGKKAPYEIYSQEFVYKVVENLLIEDVKINNDDISFVVSYPKPRDGSTRLHSIYTNYNEPYPLEFDKKVIVKLKKDNGALEHLEVYPLKVDYSGRVASKLVVPFKGSGNYEIVIEDIYGNRGVFRGSL
ncbi:MAG: neutral/alkaline non-lysosomal ceramidase N-terminal domain-containing protein [Deltaproteobacteria bacterium]|nr:neutral/alkaline non-lysosomal ceramidase N-terminal domain-containing protein [Deltaproteobacteria bacterium]